MYLMQVKKSVDSEPEERVGEHLSKVIKVFITKILKWTTVKVEDFFRKLNVFFSNF